MTRIYALIFAVALSLNCAHVQPVINTVVTCSGKTISPALVDEVYTDIMTENWTDLALTAVQALPEGWADVVCIYDALKTSNPALVGHMQKLEAAHVELRGGTALNDYQKESPAGSAPWAPAGRAFAYAGPNPGAALASCYRECGDNIDALAPPGGCECYRKVGSTWRWVAAR